MRGIRRYLGRFDLVKFLPSISKGHSWVKSERGRRPQYGDILLHTGLHEDVALDFDGDVLNRIAAGQGGRSQGCDILTRVRGKGPYSSANLQGWIDLDLYFGSSPTPTPIPYWLLGWWTVTWRGEAYYYYFDRSDVKWTQNPPSDSSRPLLSGRDTGSVTVEGPSAIRIYWGASKSVERFSRVLVGRTGFAEEMRGLWNGREQTSATKM